MALTLKQKNVYDFILNFYAENGVAPTQAEIKEAFALKSLGSVQRYLKYLKEHGLIEVESHENRGIHLVEDQIPQMGPTSVNLKLVGSVNAGPLAESFEDSGEVSLSMDHFGERDKHYIQHHYFALKVKGDSMKDAGIINGDIVVLERSSQYHNGDIVVARLDHEVTLKRLIQHQHLAKIELRPENPDFDSIWISKGEFEVQGKLHSLHRFY